MNAVISAAPSVKKTRLLYAAVRFQGYLGLLAVCLTLLHGLVVFQQLGERLRKRSRHAQARVRCAVARNQHRAAPQLGRRVRVAADQGGQHSGAHQR